MSTMVELTCAVCGVTFKRLPYEVKRNERLGRANLCGRKCHAIHMNKSPAKLVQTKAMLAERNANQWRDANPNWRGGTSDASHHFKPLPPRPCPQCGTTAQCADPRAVAPSYDCPGCGCHF